MFPVHVQIEAGLHKFRAPGRQKFPTMAPSIRGPQYVHASYHRSSAYNFEVALRFVENEWTHGLKRTKNYKNER